jgi:spermidine synthase
MLLPHIDKRFVFAIGALGFTSIITQTVLLREFLSVFSGNELVIGVVLANWMLLTGAGSLVGKFAGTMRQPAKLIVIVLLLAALLPLTTVFLLSYLRNIVFPVGTMIGMVESLYSSFLLLMPYCLLSGFLFTLFAQAVSDQIKQNLIPSVYSLEAMGSIVGGLLFNLVMVFFLTTFQSLILVTFLNLAVCLALSLKYGRPVLSSAILMAVGLVLVVTLSVNLDQESKRRLFKDQEVLVYKDTPYGNLTVTQLGDQKNFYENSILLFSTNDVTSNEEAVHYAMIQHRQPRNVLLISGGISGTIQEILKYGVDRVDYVEINPWLIEIGRRLTTSLSDDRVHIFNDDARKFVRHTAERYDVVLINVPDPGTAQINRFYTVEFFAQLRAKLTSGAVVSFSLLPSVDYLGHEARQVSSIMYNTVRGSFQNVLIVPGMRNYFLASDGPLHIDIARRIEQRGINNSYVNRYYLDDQILRERSDAIRQSMDAQAGLNRDFTPVAYYRQLLYWLSYFQFSPWILGAAIVVVLLTVMMKLNTISFGLLTGGFAASSIEVLLLVSFQIIYGYVYQATGLIITVFMAGLAVGSFYGQKRSSTVGASHFLAVQCAIGIYSLFLPLILSRLKDASMRDFIVYAIFLLLTFLIAALVGFEFCVGAILRRGGIASVAAELYGIDLVGSAIGALMVSTFLLPLLGIVKTCFLVALVSFASAVVTMVNRKQFAISSKSELAYV